MITSDGHGGTFVDRIRSSAFVPGRNVDPEVLALKHAHIRDPHVAPINALADRVADSEGIARGLVPYVDPQMGGVDAEVLALLDNPSTKAEAGTGSGLLSLENNDGSARFCAERYNDFGLAPGRVVHWNVAPAPIAGVKNGQSSPAERVRGARWLHELLELLPNLRVVLLMGDNARDGWKRSGLTPGGIVIPVAVPHPSKKGMLNRNAHQRLHRGLVATMTTLDGPALTFPSEPPPSPKARAAGKRTRAVVPKAPAKAPMSPAPPAPAAAIAPAAPALSDGEKWGWWPTFEHYSSPGSNPWGTSRSRKRVEAAIDRHGGRGRKMSPIARLTPTGWVLVAKRSMGHTIQMGPRQAGLYVKARSGGSWGNQGRVPPAPELTRPTVDLDTSQ
ncbi:hypothetical protein [Dietzia maris]|uniref:Uracil-DNA glycosylase n=1 Tax=Dietzia maris TaxID=37915 RepID=A0ABT8H2Z1_9ACTN|nr:hypothetical protein [Dietzia maris]MDN4506627.1 hypothetical protein [Dietzia maris]